jgi:DNA-directed RNA polymerase subunit beta'
MALVLFEPFLIHRLEQLGYAHDIRSAKNRIERRSPEIWGILEGTMKGRLVLLNRAPTLHRLSIQAFEPVLVEGDAIRLHPLVCTAYNADFDGDQMAVHVPLSPRAQMEARLLMMAPNNIFKPSDGKPIMAATQDIALGCYYLTAEPRQPRGPDQHLVLFGSKNEALFAYSQGAVGVHDRALLANPDLGHKTVYGDPAKRVIETTVGRIVFSEIWPEELGFYNAPAGKSEISSLIWRCYKECGQDRTVAALDKLKDIGFREATRAGISIGIDDMLIPKEKEQAILAAHREIRKVEKYKLDGVITRAECEEKSQRIWTQCTDQISEAMLKRLEANDGKPALNPLLMMLNSGARGTKQQVRQIASLRGLMAKPIRRPIEPTFEPNQEMRERPILSNFREGLGPVDWFISSYGARQGLCDTALKTKNCGYLTRKLVQVAHDVLVSEEDCGTADGLWVQAIRKGREEVVKLEDRLVGRVACDTIFDPVDPGKVLVSANQEISERSAQTLVKAGIEKVRIRSVLTCESKHGVCIYCYGRNLATGSLVKLGEAVGIIAAQSIGEPGMQLTMRTFHTGGVAS